MDEYDNFIQTICTKDEGGFSYDMIIDQYQDQQETAGQTQILFFF